MCLISRKSKTSNFWGTMICVFIKANLSSDITVEIWRTWEDSSKKVPCRITGLSHQDFDFKERCKTTDPKGQTSNWSVDSLQKPQDKDNFLFLSFQLWTHILRSKIDQLTYPQTAKFCFFVETLCKWRRRVTLLYNPLL